MPPTKRQALEGKKRKCNSMEKIKFIKWYNEDEKGYINSKEDYKKLIAMINSADDSILVKIVMEDDTEEVLYLDGYNLMYDEDDYQALKKAVKSLIESGVIK